MTAFAWPELIEIDKNVLKCDVTRVFTPSCHRSTHFLRPLCPLERDIHVLSGRALSNAKCIGRWHVKIKPQLDRYLEDRRQFVENKQKPKSE